MSTKPAKPSGKISVVSDASIAAKSRLQEIQARVEAISVADMFDMQMVMNHLSQVSEMSSAVVNAVNSTVVSMARNVKG